MFQLRNSKVQDAKRLREAVELSLPNGLLAMRPCWLVNPEAVSQIFPLAPGLFDLVIFDEASQCPTEQAVPVIYRGKRLVVSGDEKQLPPTSFFSAHIEAEEESDDEVEEATAKAVDQRQEELRRQGAAYLMQVEDLLQAAIGNLPKLSLRVHYRSEQSLGTRGARGRPRPQESAHAPHHGRAGEVARPPPPPVEWSFVIGRVFSRPRADSRPSPTSVVAGRRPSRCP